MANTPDVLVTGGTGYLGRYIVKALVGQGRSVRVLARSGSDTSGLDGVEIQAGDITVRGDLEAALSGIQRVFHVAAETRDGQTTELYDATNRQAVETLLDLAHERGIARLVHTSSYYAIGRTGEPRSSPDQVADEYWTHDPSDMHDAHEQSKYDGEHELNQRVSRGEPVLALMPTMMYGPELHAVAGPGDLRPSNRIVGMLSSHSRGDYPGIPGDGNQIWNLVHVADVAAGHIAAMEAGKDPNRWPPADWIHWHYILGGENITLNDLFGRFASLTGTAPPAHKTRRSGLMGRLMGGRDPRSPERFALDSHSWAYTSEFAAADFGYRSRPLDEGLAETVEWMRSSSLLG